MEPVVKQRKPNPWNEHCAEYAAKHGIDKMAVRSNPECRAAYNAKKGIVAEAVKPQENPVKPIVPKAPKAHKAPKTQVVKKEAPKVVKKEAPKVENNPPLSAKQQEANFIKEYVRKHNAKKANTVKINYNDALKDEKRKKAYARFLKKQQTN